jgi:hypothetical protein
MHTSRAYPNRLCLARSASAIAMLSMMDLRLANALRRA